jgi:transposase InsO family protein
VIYHTRGKYPVTALCAFFGISRAAYYAWVQRMDRRDPDAERMQLIQEAYAASHRTYGYRRIQIWLARQRGLRVNHKAILRLMRKLGIRSIARRRRPLSSTLAEESLHRYPDRLQRDFTASRPNEKWVTDITFVQTRQGWGYLSTIQDLYDGFIVAHEFGSDKSVGLVQRTITQARRREPALAGVILHSDQGNQYCSQVYHAYTQQADIVPSMSRRGNCWDNAPIESFFSHLKEEALRHYRNPSFHEARQVIDDYMAFYNYERIQLKTRLTPYERRCQSL